MTNQWIDKWSEDIEQLKTVLPLRHKNLFFQQNKRAFYSKIKKLLNNLEDYDHYMIIVKIAEIIAMFGDAHTTLVIPAARFIPLKFYWFAEGVYIVNAADHYKEFVNCKVTHINGNPINTVIQMVTSIVSHENTSFLMSQLPKYLSAYEVLYGLEVIDGFSQVEVTVETLNYEIKNVILNIGQDGEHKNSIPLNSTPSISTPLNSIPFYRRNADRNFWSYFIEDSNTLYFNYNSCSDMRDISVGSFCAGLMNFINQKDVRKLVIDMRNNLGGNSTLLEPFIRELRNCKKLNKNGGIFVIVGRDTFSSALLNVYSFKNKTMAIFIGEPSGGKPNCYGEVQYLDLKNSRLKIRYSTEYYKIIKDDKQLSFFPDILCEVTFKDYIENRDPCMDYILSMSGER